MLIKRQKNEMRLKTTPKRPANAELAAEKELNGKLQELVENWSRNRGRQ